MQRIIPPYLFLTLLLCIGVGRVWLGADQRLVPAPWPVALSAVCLLLGAISLIWGNLHHQRFNADHNTFATPDRLVTTGPFRLSRNPMYLGFVLILLAAAFASNAAWALLAPLVFIAVANTWYIPFEERRLHKAFGPDYEAYRSATRRWI